MTATTHPISDRAVSWLRTVVPVLWGSAVAAILRATTPHLPGDLGTALADWLSSETTLTIVTAAAIAAWYALWRWAEPRLPDWLTRLVLGSAQTPTYAGRPTTDTGTEYAPPTSGTPPGVRGRRPNRSNTRAMMPERAAATDNVQRVRDAG